MNVVVGREGGVVMIEKMHDVTILKCDISDELVVY